SATTSGTSPAPWCLPCRLRHRPRARAREVDDERGALADFAGDADAAAELLDDLARDGQAEAEAAALGRDEILEDGLQAIRRDAAAGVVDAHLHALVVPLD